MRLGKRKRSLPTLIIHMRHHHLLSSIAWLTACAPASQSAYIAPTPQTIVSRTVEPQGDQTAHTIYVENRSTVPVTVWSVTLTGCENVKQTCGPRRVNLRVPPRGQVMAMRVEPDSPIRGFGYRFGFSWRADSAHAGALAERARAGDSRSMVVLEARRRADSLDAAGDGGRYRELSRDDFRALAGQRVSLRALPETLAMEPGTRLSPERTTILVVDSAGRVLGRTRWLRSQMPGAGAVSFSPAERQLTALRLGRSTMRFHLAEEALALLGSEVPELQVPIVVRYTPDPNAPIFGGRALDAESRSPLACVRVSLEDAAQNVVVTGRSDSSGSFRLRPPRAGSYRVRAEAHGWAPVAGSLTPANAGEEQQLEHLVRFTEQVLVTRFGADALESEPPRPVAVRVDAVSRGAGGSGAVVQAVTLGGSQSMPILGIVTSRVAPSSMWMQVAIDSTGQVISSTLLLPGNAPARARDAVAAALTRMRFAPAKENGRPVCELMRLQVNFSPR